MKKALSYLTIVRPANVVTSVADVVAGVVIAGAFTNESTKNNVTGICLLCCSTACLYAGGIVFNDVFDVNLDRIERPERAIPSGLISLKQAILTGSLLLGGGIAFAGLQSLLSMLLALLIAAAALIYDKAGKRHAFFGPLNMGICRGLNLLLGVSIIPLALFQYYTLAIVPLIYIFSITMVSRGEVHGGNKSNLYIAAILYIIVTTFIVTFSYFNHTLLCTSTLLIPFLWMIFKPLSKAIKNPVGKNIGAAVKAGVLSLILMDAAWAATFGNIYAAILILCLLPGSLWLAKTFAVT
ncbi:polyprenyltransferase [Mucilaginibacter pallidiroseus]|uniref:Polyprenyltransferase n=1 Tax=Mucilaginibacter pallidiroseus TaxID=2599295 RepID=A0A563UC98_9SPHI|nr:UbiA-like protein EboC [Mucilaginibacter pallidiroseus]TWR28879.1 polyprenyltransferase [Mucilaginibacter pallidiroseus]